MERERAASAARVAAFLSLSTLLAVAWYPMTGVISDGTQAPSMHLHLAQLLVGGFLTGVAFLATSRLLGRAPSVWFGLLIPATLATALMPATLLVEGWLSPSERNGDEILASLYLSYTCLSCVSLPLGIAHAWVLRLIQGKVDTWAAAVSTSVARNFLIGIVAVVSLLAGELPHWARVDRAISRDAFGLRVGIAFPKNTTLIRTTSLSYFSTPPTRRGFWCFYSPSPIPAPANVSVKQRATPEIQDEAEQIIRHFDLTAAWLTAIPRAYEYRWSAHGKQYIGIWIQVDGGHCVIVQDDEWHSGPDLGLFS